MNNSSGTMVWKEVITGSRRLSNYIWAIITLLGGTGFVLAGLSSYLNVELLPFTKTSNLLFIPQGIIMMFYGITAILLSIFLWTTIVLDIGSGYNKFDKLAGIITIFRFGFPGKNRKICLTYHIQSITAVQIKIQNGLNPKREIYLRTKDERKIPITRIGEPLFLLKVEKQAADLAKFLNVLLEKLS